MLWMSALFGGRRVVSQGAVGSAIVAGLRGLSDLLASSPDAPIGGAARCCGAGGEETARCAGPEDPVPDHAGSVHGCSPPPDGPSSDTERVPMTSLLRSHTRPATEERAPDTLRSRDVPELLRPSVPSREPAHASCTRVLVGLASKRLVFEVVMHPGCVRGGS
jgi:hypothetical protein